MNFYICHRNFKFKEAFYSEVIEKFDKIKNISSCFKITCKISHTFLEVSVSLHYHLQETEVQA